MTRRPTDARIVATQRDKEVRLGAELERLRAELADESELARSAAWELDELRAEIERLRAAIRKHRERTRRSKTAPSPTERELWEVLGNE